MKTTLDKLKQKDLIENIDFELLKKIEVEQEQEIRANKSMALKNIQRLGN